MAEKKYYWLKLSEGFFQQKEIKKLRRIAGGDTYTIIYLKLLLRSLSNNGFLYYEGIEPTFAEELALDIDEETENVSVTLSYLHRYGILEEKSEDEFFLLTTGEMTGSETGAARRMRNKRKREKAPALPAHSVLPAIEPPERNNVTPECNDVQNSYGDVRDRYIEIDIEKEIEKEKKKRNNAPASFLESVSEIVSFLNEQTGKSYKASTKKTREAIHARLKEGFTVEDFKTVIAKKCAEWLNDDKMDRYLRPETLFGPKFEGYLNEKPKGGAKNGGDTKHGRRNVGADGKNPEGHDYGVVF